MDKKTLIAVAVVAILVVAAAGVYAVNNNKDKSSEPVSALKDAELKVFGNINGDKRIDQDDVKIMQRLVDEKKTAAEYPLADANQDGALTQEDVDIVKKVATGQSTTIWHVSYHDINGDGTMDEKIVSTKFPIKSAIMTGSANTSMFMLSMGVVDEIKGASYSSTSMDKALFKDTFLNTDKVVKLGTSATTITFEDGKAGSSDVIAKENVTCLVTDWNRSYITNEADFEAGGVDVIRLAAASLDRAALTHSALLIGLLFQKMSYANQYLDLSFGVMDYVENALKGATPVKAVASSSNGSFSSADSDYTALIVKAGGVFGAAGVDFGGASSVKYKDHPEFNACDCDVIFHIRTAIGYDQTPESVKENYEKYAAEFSTWKHADDGQYMVSGTLPIALRLAYAASALHSDLVDINVVNKYHQQLVDKLYGGLSFNISEMNFVVTPETFA